MILGETLSPYEWCPGSARHMFTRDLDHKSMLWYRRSPLDLNTEDVSIDLIFSTSCFNSVHGVLKQCGRWFEDRVFGLFSRKKKGDSVSLGDLIFFPFNGSRL